MVRIKRAKLSPKIAAMLKKNNQGIKLDLGGGGNPQPGFVNIDVRKLPEVDIVHDLEKFPWPLPDESVGFMIASHVLEHIDPAHGNFLKFMDECWRVLKPGAEFMIAVPYAGSAGFYQDPTHCNPCTERTWAYFDPLEAGGGLYRIYEPAPWHIKMSTWNAYGNMEVVLVKRRDDASYHASKKLKYAKKVHKKL
jgi:SAM-dependent methyltransferase